MGTISQMAQKCQKCPKRDKCDRKRMEMCAYIDEPKATVSASISNGIDVPVTNVGGTAKISMENITKQIEKSINKSLFMNCGW